MSQPTNSLDAIAPHGGKLIDRAPSPAQRPELLAEAKRLPSIRLGIRECCDLEMIGIGAFSPLDGFMCQANYQRVLAEGRLADGVPWSVPITLAPQEIPAGVAKGGRVALLAPAGNGLPADGERVLGILTVQERYKIDKAGETQRVFQGDDKHPGVAYMMTQTGEEALGGPLDYLDRLPPPFPTHCRDPKDTRALFRERGWKRIAAFQTRNPIHRAHEYLTKVALEICDGLLLHPLVGHTKDDDIPAAVRMQCYEALLAGYYPKARVVLSTLGAAMRYAGPKEAILHAIIRKNYGCTHFIVGRDHAGVGKYYGSYDAQKMFEQYTPEEMGITPLRFENSFFCKSCGEMATAKTCPHDEASWIVLSGTKVRDMLRAGERPPAEFSRPEVSQILIAAMKE